MKKVLKHILKKIGYTINKIQLPDNNMPVWTSIPEIPDKEFYQPTFSPWMGYGKFADYYTLASRHSLVSADRCYILYCIASQCSKISGEFFECGVYKGGTASMLSAILKDTNSSAKLHLFDTFEGMPETSQEFDLHKKGDFSDTSLEAVKSYIRYPHKCEFHKGFIPETFIGLEDKFIAFAHIDLDIYNSIKDSLNFIWPRLVAGGVIIFDDYGFSSCPGARRAVDDFFEYDRHIPMCLPTGQCLVFKS